MNNTTKKAYIFTPLDTIIEKNTKKKKFRKAFSEEMARLALARHIRALREERKLTQKNVAEKAQMPQSVIARIESGAHSFSVATLSRIAGALGKKIYLADADPVR
jgi:ribosome-binding protein aMBF1 (putative translation factor)